MLKNRLLPLFLLVVCVFGSLAGCTININMGNADENTVNETNGKTIFDYIFNGKEETTMYESRATIYISTTFVPTNNSISSSDLTVSERHLEIYNLFLQTPMIQDKIREQYPGAEYALSLTPIDDTASFALIVTSESPEHLEEICNLAASRFCDTTPGILKGWSCSIIDYAKSVQKVGAN